MAQAALILTLQSAQTANANGVTANLTGYKTALVEVVESNNGTVTLTPEGSFDGTNWYTAGYELVDATASPTRAASGISVTGNTKHVYLLLDLYPLFRARTSSISSATVTVRVYALPI